MSKKTIKVEPDDFAGAAKVLESAGGAIAAAFDKFQHNATLGATAFSYNSKKLPEHYEHAMKAMHEAAGGLSGSLTTMATAFRKVVELYRRLDQQVGKTFQ